MIGSGNILDVWSKRNTNVVSSLARTALALLCAVALIYGTALIPAVFDVHLATTSPEGPTANGPGNDLFEETQTEDEGDDSSSGTETTATATATATERATATQASGGSGGSSGGPPVAVLFAVVGLVAIALVAFRDADLDGAFGFSLPSFGLPAVSIPWITIPTPGSVLGRIPQLTTWLLVSGGSGFARVVGDLVSLGKELARGFSGASGPLRSIVAGTLLAGPRVIAALAVAPIRGLAGLGSLFAGVPVLGSSLTDSNPLADDPPDADARIRADVDPEGDGDQQSIESVVAAWETLVASVPVQNPEATTPAEYARKAVSLGFPETPVRRLTGLFREVRYGGRRESEERVTVARRAIDAIREVRD